MKHINETSEVDLDDIQVPWTADDYAPTDASSVKPYLRGPVPWCWLQHAIGLGASATATGLAIWHLRSLRRSSTFSASLYQLGKWTGLSEKATRGGLQRLEAYGLVQVERPAGCSPTITLLTKSS